MTIALQVVWFKKDLRVADHGPLYQASQQGPCLCLYVVEPLVFEDATFDAAHARFIQQSLIELDTALRQKGGQLVVMHGDVLSVLACVYAAHAIHTLWSHEETGLGVTYQRDKAVAAWCKENGICWVELPQTGVVRRLKNRDTWAAKWTRRMTAPLWPEPNHFLPLPAYLSAVIKPGIDIPTLRPSQKVTVQVGGVVAAQHCLQSFLTERGQPYQRGMSSPVTAWDQCSRLSPYLTWGNVSVRQVYQATLAQIASVQADNHPHAMAWTRALRSFEKRLHWHCHFMQKLEDEPAIEFNNVNRAFDGLRENDFNPVLFDAWCAGQTGYPLVDACMRCLHQTGWINFRMRAMLVSFAAYHLWLHWRQPAVFLAQHFLDFEPGIHFPQFQMQSGVTGINTIRIYSPVKQAEEQDPDGVFIRQYVPELAAVPNAFIHQPHTLPPLLALSVGFQPGVTYPLPVVDHMTVYRAAKTKVFDWLQKPEVKAAADAVYQKHGSRSSRRQR
jgi:deoxyribodipyrimidine photo-lyase